MSSSFACKSLGDRPGTTFPVQPVGLDALPVSNPEKRLRRRTPPIRRWMQRDEKNRPTRPSRPTTTGALDAHGKCLSSAILDLEIPEDDGVTGDATFQAGTNASDALPPR